MTIRGLEFGEFSINDGNVVADDQWNTDCLAFNLQALPSQSSIERIGGIQVEAAAALPGQNLVPTEALHISVLNLVHSRSAMTIDEKMALWDGHAAGWISGIDTVMAGRGPIDVAFDRLVVGPSSIMVAASTSEAIIDLRNALIDALALDVKAPELCHISIMRFTRNARIDAARQAISKIDARFVARIDKVRLMREYVYPSLKVETLREYMTASSASLAMFSPG